MIKSTAIDPSVVDATASTASRGPAKVFISEPAAIAAIKAGQITCRRRARADLPRADGRRDGGDLSAHRRR